MCDRVKATSAPCGNAGVDESDDVINKPAMPGKRRRVIIDGPEEEIETEGKRHLQNLAKKQLLTNITLRQQMSQHRDFVGTNAFKPKVESLSGVVDLSEYQKLNQTDARIEELGHYGLTDEEIQLKIKYENSDSDELSKKSGLGVNPQVEREALIKIDMKIKEKKGASTQSNQFSDVQRVTRHELDLERAICANDSEEAKISQALVQQKVYDKSNPLSMVPQLMSELDSKVHEHFRTKRAQRKLRRKERAREKYVENQDTNIDDRTVLPDNNNDSDSDDDNQPFIGPLPKPLTDDHTCEKLKTITTAIKPIDEKHITGNRLSVAEILKLPRFENYEEGVKDNTLYLKNLHSKVTQEDLIALFGRFQTECKANIVYKLMNGRMRGQAFITFNDSTVAEEALQLVNGYKLYGKPVIIQYKRRNNK